MKFSYTIGEDKKMFTFAAKSLKEAKPLALKFATKKGMLPVHLVCKVGMVPKFMVDKEMPIGQPAIKEAVEAILNDNNIIGMLAPLQDRWEDEKKYEDWKDYEDQMRKFDLKGFKFIRGTKRPFGFKMKVNLAGKLVQVSVKWKGDSANLVAKNCK